MKLHPLLRGFKLATKPPDRRTPWQWCEEHVVVDPTSPFPGKWRSDNSPWVKAPMEAAADPNIRRIAIVCSAQAAKTQMCICLMCWIVDQEPGPALYVMAAKDEARDFMRDRILPTFSQCKPVNKRLTIREAMTFVFSSMPVYFTGSHSKSKLQSKPIRWLFCDEVRNYDDGILELALKRTRQFFNAKEFVISTANKANDVVDSEFKSGTQEVWSTLCPKCGHVEPLLFSRLEWDVEEAAKPYKEFNINRITDSIRLRCGGCDHKWRDVPHERRQIASQGRFVVQNPNAARNRRSFTWNALLPPNVPWAGIVEEYFAAMQHAKAEKQNLYPLKRFYNETMGMPWEEALGEVEDYSFLEDRKQDYAFNDPWPEETARFIAADKQAEGGEHYWWLVRAFGPAGKSRLIAYGRAESFAELEEVRARYNVPLSNAMIDSGYKTSEVYRFSARTGWKAFKGDQAEMYTHEVEDPTTRKRTIVHRLWKKPEQVDPSHFRFNRKASNIKKVYRYLFSSHTTKDFLAEFMTGIVGEWSIPRAIGSDYVSMVTAERRCEKVDTKGRVSFFWKQTRRANHLLDCELMIIVAAIISKHIHGGVVRMPKAAVNSPQVAQTVPTDTQKPQENGVEAVT